MAVRSMDRGLEKWQLDSKFLHGPQNHWEKVQLVHLCGMCVIQFSGLVWLVVLFNFVSTKSENRITLHSDPPHRA